jgi:hypothetical protein
MRQLYKLYDEFPKSWFTEFNGFDCGNGWYSILHHLFARFNSILGAGNSSFKIYQIKEKFGGLRVYTSHYETVKTVIKVAELESLYTCDICGDSGTFCDINGWYLTRCNKHNTQ